MKLNNMKSNYQHKLLNLEIKEAHTQINYLKWKIENIEKSLYSKILKVIVDNFVSSNNNRFSYFSRKVKDTLVNKFNKIRPSQNSIVEDFINIDKSKWLVNLNGKDIPDSITNILSLYFEAREGYR